MANASSHRLTPAAVRDLERIWFYTFEHWGADQADHYIDALGIAFAEIALSPQSSPACDYIRLGYRRRVIERHVIFFQITKYGIQIVRILHQRMDAFGAISN